MQTQTQRISLASIHTHHNNAELNHGEQSGYLFSHELKEIGQHILICECQYAAGISLEEGPLYIRKFFKFIVGGNHFCMSYFQPINLLFETSQSMFEQNSIAQR